VVNFFPLFHALHFLVIKNKKYIVSVVIYRRVAGKGCIHATRCNVPYISLIYLVSYSVRQLSHIFIFLGNSYLSQLTGSDSYKLRVILTRNIAPCSMNASFSFDLFMVYIQECNQQLRTMK
jgi:hypothetical protein